MFQPILILPGFDSDGKLLGVDTDVYTNSGCSSFDGEADDDSLYESYGDGGMWLVRMSGWFKLVVGWFSFSVFLREQTLQEKHGED